MKSNLHAYIVAAAFVLLGTTGTALAQADLQVQFSGGPNGSSGGGPIPIAPGSQAAYFLKVTNNGPSPASGVVVTVSFPPKTSISNFGPPGTAVCSSSVVAGSPTLTCTQASLAVNGSFAIVITLGLAFDYPWQDDLSATASATSATPDTLSSNNSVTVILAVEGRAAIPALNRVALTLLMAALALAGLVLLSGAKA